MTLKDFLPIRKLVVGIATTALLHAAHKFLHIDLGASEVNAAVDVLVGYAAAYAVKDPRVQSLESALGQKPAAEG